MTHGVKQLHILVGTETETSNTKRFKLSFMRTLLKMGKAITLLLSTNSDSYSSQRMTRILKHKTLTKEAPHLTTTSSRHWLKMNCKHSLEEAMKMEETCSAVEETSVNIGSMVQEENHAHLNRLLNLRFQLKFWLVLTGDQQELSTQLLTRVYAKAAGSLIPPLLSKVLISSSTADSWNSPFSN